MVYCVIFHCFEEFNQIGFLCLAYFSEWQFFEATFYLIFFHALVFTFMI